MPSSLFSLFYVTGEFHRFLHRGRADFGGIFKIIQVYERWDGANKMQIEQHCSIFTAKKLETASTTKKNKVRFRLNNDVRKEMEDSRLNAIEIRKKYKQTAQVICFIYGNMVILQPVI